ncbi:MAG: hypothetical protein JRN58_04080 [Nitrososphaerota archaeon]|nr:hypothetical protein [Nitrososphaerota archaeon]MDG6978242.1 hypothetical protein [Nitrososphaerota archaeon]
MRKGHRATSSRALVMVAVAVAAVVAAGVASSGILSSTAPGIESTGATPGSTQATSTFTASSAAILNDTRETVSPSIGLELLLSVNSTTIPSEDAISVNASVVDARPTPVNVSASSVWPISGLTSGVCDFGPGPVGIAFFRGYYGENNVSGAEAIDIWPPIACPASDVLNATSFEFLPHSDAANYSGYFGSYANSTKGVSSTRATVGASPYAANGTGFYYSLDSALPATYTLAAGDEWGQLVLLHFDVTESGLLPKVGNFLSSIPGCSPGACDAQRFSDAMVFHCAPAAATTAGCQEQYDSGLPGGNYTVTVWYPPYNKTGQPAWANCEYQVWPTADLLSPNVPPSPGYCLMVGPTSFVVTNRE